MHRGVIPVVDLRTRLALAGDPSVMGILEKLRPQPRWKHADPGVRAAAVYELGPDEGEALRLLAREDTEARVRRAAVTRLTISPSLATSAGPIPTRTFAPKRSAVWPAWRPRPTKSIARHEAVRHLVALGRFKEVVVVGPRESRCRRFAPPSSICSTIRSRSERSAVTRRTAQTRLRALARLTDAEEILNVAMKSEHTDVGGVGARSRRRRRVVVGDRAACAQQSGGPPGAHEASSARRGRAAARTKRRRR